MVQNGRMTHTNAQRENGKERSDINQRLRNIQQRQNGLINSTGLQNRLNKHTSGVTPGARIEEKVS